ncbi:MAG TPA: phosphotransferase [Thermomicrobiales bacterium]|jgi:Ser/Thr protein kinase RdoA (MazF antagonist)|nr:phosphotransferase [Thermomicrobiales bacterium]
MLQTPQDLAPILADWKTILGDAPTRGEPSAGRELWPVTAEDGARYFLKRLGPWRNLPLADEARILRHLASHGVPVAEFIPNDHAMLYAGAIEDCFVLVPRLVSDRFDALQVVPVGEQIGEAIGQLHVALARYPWSANSYQEQTIASLQGALMLPPDVAVAFEQRRDQMIAALADLPTQLIHGDLTPDNVLLRQPGAVSGFIDFDHLPLAPRTWDIARYLSRRVRRRWRQGNALSDSDRLVHVAGVLRGYHRVNPLTAIEIDGLVAGMTAGNVLDASYLHEISAGTLDRRRMPDHDAELADTVEAALWLLNGYEQVVDSVRRWVG